MPDGTRLSARLWLPMGAGPAPAIFEYIPYRKRDLVRARDERNHPYLAAHGFACLRVDMRGSGDSEGRMSDMYAHEERADARVVVDWIATQDWCNGRIGMFGTSWGGTASLQANVDAPHALKAVIAVCAAADRFEDDIHWRGGTLLTDTLEWGATMPAILAAPPDRATVGDDWFAMWQDRLKYLAFPLEDWIRNKTRGTYWRTGSVAFEAEKLTRPILAIGGWSDGYSTSVMKLLKARPDLTWGIVGPWGHHYPDVGEPGPAMGFQDLSLAWWTAWLRDDQAPDWPKLRVWQRRFEPPQNRLMMRKGDWVETHTFDSEPSEALSLKARDAERNFDGLLPVPWDPAHGHAAGDTGHFGRTGGLPLDQADDDGRALCFETPPLEEPQDLAGFAAFSCVVERDRPEAHLIARLCDVAPDGRSNLVVWQARNLGLDDSLDGPVEHQTGIAHELQLRFPAAAYRFAKGHRIRLSLAASYWPLVWPTEGDPGLRMGAASVRLMLERPQALGPLAAALPAPKSLPENPTWETCSKRSLTRTRSLREDGKLSSGWRQPTSTTTFADQNLTISTSSDMHLRWSRTPGTRPECTVRYSLEISRPDGVARITSRLRATTGTGGIAVDASLDARWDDTPVARKEWTFDI